MLFHKIAEISPLPDLRLLVRFMSGEMKQYDLKSMLERQDTFQALTDDELFQQVRIDAGGFGISWNDEIDLSCNELWENGQNENSGKMTSHAQLQRMDIS
ncbi:DUF2442 domain-containing protein [Desulfobulbus sp. F4]|nr:DUF2442 domain-containing protein [Desulfobulbus sp. F3]MCW5200487.1 DUF2442 domain-containing protein [Desulfobulbus sp. F4]